MLKHILLIVALSLLVVLGATYFHQVLQWLLSAHDWVSSSLVDIFSGGKTGSVIRNLLALLSIPLLVGLIPLFFYWLVKRQSFPYFIEFIWVTWLILTASMVVLNKLV